MKKDEWRLLGYGLLAALLIELALLPIFVHHIQIPRVLSLLICGAIVVMVFALADYMRRRRNRNKPHPNPSAR